jgi:hypothetical protein
VKVKKTSRGQQPTRQKWGGARIGSVMVLVVLYNLGQQPKMAIIGRFKGTIYQWESIFVQTFGIDAPDEITCAHCDGMLIAL